MTGIQDDLATLRELVQYDADRSDNLAPSLDALARVEAEIARLTELYNGYAVDSHQHRDRAETAEAEVARLKDGLRRIAGDLEIGQPNSALYLARALLADDGAADERAIENAWLEDGAA